MAYGGFLLLLQRLLAQDSAAARVRQSHTMELVRVAGQHANARVRGQQNDGKKTIQRNRGQEGEDTEES
jgi:hypothetical protein